MSKFTNILDRNHVIPRVNNIIAHNERLAKLNERICLAMYNTNPIIVNNQVQLLVDGLVKTSINIKPGVIISDGFDERNYVIVVTPYAMFITYSTYYEREAFNRCYAKSYRTKLLKELQANHVLQLHKKISFYNSDLKAKVVKIDGFNIITIHDKTIPSIIDITNIVRVH
jgi:hypothetical protein